MRKFYVVFAAIALFFAQQGFAATDANTAMASSDSDGMSAPSCDTIAKACLSANYDSHGDDKKAFWHDCMKPILLGQTVEGVTISKDDADACRKAKISKMKQELKVFQQVR